MRNLVVGVIAWVEVAVGADVARVYIALGRIVPVSGIRTATFVICSLVPLVLAGQEPPRSGVSPDRAAIARNLAVCARLCVAVSLAVIHPVNETKRVPIGRPDNRPVTPGGHILAGAIPDRIREAAPFAVALNVTEGIAWLIWPHEIAIQPIGVSQGLVVQEIAVLRRGYFVFADIVDVIYGPADSVGTKSPSP